MTDLIKWFVKNPVAANLIMLVIFGLGIIGYVKVGKTAMPSAAMDIINVSVPYLGAGPKEVEDRIVIRLEEAVFDIRGIKRLAGRASEGVGSVTIEIEEDEDVESILNQVKARVDAINTFPSLSERPIVSRSFVQMDIMNLAIYGDATEFELKELGRSVRDRLAAIPGAAKTALNGEREYEVSIEISELQLQKFNLTFDQVSNAISQSSTNLPAGKVDSIAGQIQIVTRGQAYVKQDFEDIVVLQNADGTRVLLKDVANVVDGFTDDHILLRMNGKPGLFIFIRSESTPDVVKLSAEINQVINEEIIPSLPEGIEITNWFDTSEIFKSRLDMLMWNAVTGLILVFFSLMIFLSPALAGWVTAGIAISFLGCFAILPYTGVALSMISLFAFLLILGIVVDDAIIIGESVHLENQKGNLGDQGAIDGAAKVARPVIFSAITTMIFFSPMLFIEGIIGQFVLGIPVVVILCLTFSILESLFILPVHLRHLSDKKSNDFARIFMIFIPNFIIDSCSKMTKAAQNSAKSFLSHIIKVLYRPFLDKALKRKGFSLLVILSMSMIITSIHAAGWIKMVFNPEVSMNFIQARVQFPAGAPYDIVDEASYILENKARELQKELEAEYPDVELFKDLLVMADGNGSMAFAFLVFQNIEEVNFDVEKYVARWREIMPVIPDAREISFDFSTAGGTGEAINLMLKSPNSDALDQMALDVKQVYAEYAGLYSITDTADTARTEAVLSIMPSAENMGLTLTDLARQVRQAFYGQEVQRIARGKDTVKVMVRLPQEDRRSFDTLDEMRIRTGAGGEVPFEAVAEVDYQRAYTSIRRTDRQRTLTVKANVNKDVANTAEIVKDIQEKYVDQWKAKYPDVEISFEGDQKNQQEFASSLASGFGFALIAIYILLAVAFNSYSQPFIILTALPFAYMGAVLGHLFLGMNFSLYSIMGIVAAAGVVVNDNLVLLDYINRLRKEGKNALEAVEIAAEERFRPIFLTSFTTFIGLAPMMLETSLQAQFLIPTVVSLAFGVLFSTMATLFLVPIVYLYFHDFRKNIVGLFKGRSPDQITAE
ncbi:MAG: efflux RND transporter permease subunit [Emcibacteraceae bacterium]|nr:efflux RND transporter permease subunit [Emcibacteraceae bacterium]